MAERLTASETRATVAETACQSNFQRQVDDLRDAIKGAR
jgi:hypothetical protein